MIVSHSEQDFNKWIGDTLDEIRNHIPPDVSERCPHCANMIRFPVITKQSDIEKFERLINSAYKIMDKYNITANLLAEIRADCLIQLAKTGGRNEL